MAKLLLALALIILVYVVFQEVDTSSEKDTIQAKPTPIVKDLLPLDEADIKELIRELPIDEEDVVEVKKNEKKPLQRKGLSSLTLTGTIYGVDQPSAMLVDRNGKSFIIKQGEQILKSKYKLIRVAKDQIIVERAGKYYRLKMNKNPVSK